MQGAATSRAFFVTLIAFMTSRTQIFVRAFIAVIVIVLTFTLTYRSATMSENWTAIFLLVIGYYFKDRPSTEQAAQSPNEFPDITDARLELLAQLVSALLLVFATAILFIYPKPRAEIAGAWIGGVALAVGFYFKEAGVTVTAHAKAQAALAIVMLALTLGIYVVSATLPLQWISLVFLVVAFYFKERASTTPAPAPQAG
jgi:hypothetical protein